MFTFHFTISPVSVFALLNIFPVVSSLDISCARASDIVYYFYLLTTSFLSTDCSFIYGGPNLRPYAVSFSLSNALYRYSIPSSVEFFILHFLFRCSSVSFCFPFTSSFLPSCVSFCVLLGVFLWVRAPSVCLYISFFRHRSSFPPSL